MFSQKCLSIAGHSLDPSSFPLPLFISRLRGDREAKLLSAVGLAESLSLAASPAPAGVDLGGSTVALPYIA